jgi:hypothetical protein
VYTSIITWFEILDIYEFKTSQAFRVWLRKPRPIFCNDVCMCYVPIDMNMTDFIEFVDDLKKKRIVEVRTYGDKCAFRFSNKKY